MSDPLEIKYAPRWAMWLGRMIALIVSRAVWFIRFEGLENIPSGTAPLIVASNHQTYIDPVWITIPLKRRRMRFMAFDKAFEWNFIGPLIRFLGAFPIDQREGTGISAIKESIRTIRDGGTLVIFPEGGRAFADGKLLEFKTGVARIAISTDASILPVTISGGHEIWPNKRKYPRLFRQVTIKFHKPIAPRELSTANPIDKAQFLTDRLAETIATGSTHRQTNAPSHRTK
jgi:1-acyl-sn-glycerol-3-phosphate acyltransferase